MQDKTSRTIREINATMALLKQQLPDNYPHLSILENQIKQVALTAIDEYRSVAMETYYEMKEDLNTKLNP